MAGDIFIVRPQGRLEQVTGRRAFEEAIAEGFAGGADKMLLDMAELDYINSAGLRIVLQAAKRMDERGGQFMLCSLNEAISEVFVISGFSTLLNIAPNRELAVKRLREDE